MRHILLLDNNDSFTFNIVELIRKIGGWEVDVVNSSQCTLRQVANYQKIIFSPGPGVPDDFPIMKSTLDMFADRHFLGICLGFQAICEYFGATLINKSRVVHGEPHLLTIHNTGVLYEGVVEPAMVGLYHSWEVESSSITLPLRVTSCANDSVMSVEHLTRSVFGVQYHPESYMSSCGKQVLTNFLSL